MHHSMHKLFIEAWSPCKHTGSFTAIFVSAVKKQSNGIVAQSEWGQ